MPDFQQYAFIGGEYSAEIIGRGDLERYGLGVAYGKNFFVEYRGGLSTRTGTEFCEYVQNDDLNVRLWSFQFSPDVSDTYVLVIGDGYIRFVQDGSYILEGLVTITGITQANPGVVTTSGAHGYSNGDYVKISTSTMTELDGRTFTVSGVTATTFVLLDQFGNSVDTTAYSAYTTGGGVARVYTVAHSYDEADLPYLNFWQNRDVIRITHVDYAPAALVRADTTSWTLSSITFGATGDSPTNVTITPSSAGSAGVGFQVTAISLSGEESLPSGMAITEVSVNYTVTAGSAVVEWDAVSDTAYYQIYRTLVLPTGSNISLGDEVGYAGRSFSPRFVDANIVPDFTVAPPVGRNPFANGAITFIDITAPGSSYAKSDTVSVSGGGSGFVGYPIVNSAGEIIAVTILNGGSGYSSPTVSFGTSTGSGATATATVGAASGNYPAYSVQFQQRYVYLGTTNNPMVLYASKANASYDNFDVSLTSTAADSYSYELDSEEVAPIRWAVPGLGGLVIGTADGIWLLKGAEDQNVTAQSAQAEELGSGAAGTARLAPLKIDNTIVYLQRLGGVVQALIYNYTLRNYRPRDLTVQSAHLLGKNKEISRWAYIAEPHFMIWCVRADGRALTLTYLPEENVIGLMRHETKGLYKDVVAITEGTRNIPYFLVKRYINGRWSQFLERGKPRDFDYVEDYWGVDAGIELVEQTPAADLTFAASTGTNVAVTASAAVFSSANVGDVIRAGGGRATISAYSSSGKVYVDFTRDLEVIDEEVIPDVLSGTWTLSTPTDTITGLDHLEGQSVVGLADGNYVGPFTVTNGAITMQAAYSRVKIGLGYDCLVKNLPLQSLEIILQGKVKRTLEVGVRVSRTVGLQYGSDLDYLYEIPFRSDEGWGEETGLAEGFYRGLNDAPHTYDDQIWLRQPYPLPATIIGLLTPRDIEDVD